MTKTGTKKTKTAAEQAPVVVAYKGFNKDLTCRDFQFEIGKTYTQKGTIRACTNGFHACENPLDVWGYYDVVGSRFALVEMSGAMARHDSDSKIASATITIKAELKLPEFVKAAVDWVINATKGKGDDPSGHSAKIGSSGDYAQIGSSGDYAQIGSSGDYAKIGSSGDYAQIGSSGDYAKIGSSGHYAKIGSSGDYAKIGSSGHYAKIGSSGDYAQIGSSGDYAQIGSSGDYAKIGSSGHSAKIEASGNKAVIASAGYSATAKGARGTWISIAEYDSNSNCIGFATGCIGQHGLEPDTFYRAQGGKLIAA